MEENNINFNNQVPQPIYPQIAEQPKSNKSLHYILGVILLVLSFIISINTPFISEMMLVIKYSSSLIFLILIWLLIFKITKTPDKFSSSFFISTLTIFIISIQKPLALLTRVQEGQFSDMKLLLIAIGLISDIIFIFLFYISLKKLVGLTTKQSIINGIIGYLLAGLIGILSIAIPFLLFMGACVRGGGC